MTDSVGGPLGDIAERVASQLITEAFAPVAEASAIIEEEALKTTGNIFGKIRFSWRAEDRAALERIRVAADSMFAKAFEAAITVVDHFYEQLRIPEQRNGIVVCGTDGRPVWKRDERGQFIERWDQLTGQDIEFTLVNLERIKLAVAPRVNELMLEALYARNVASEMHDEKWLAVMDGTVSDRTAKANRESKVDHYHAFFRFYLYSVADTFLKEISAFCKLLENVRYWQVRTQKG